MNQVKNGRPAVDLSPIYPDLKRQYEVFGSSIRVLARKYGPISYGAMRRHLVCAGVVFRKPGGQSAAAKSSN